eukprot:CAMPEP_0119344972 /NCGR_PEP_ID=MMETSP1333-20130426/107245_1 /TAXON_ID=418940 /ORGANISM="Scyphosphaera apsteinii, Strain RCC1455" /LENGTH=265 /DNA_ID=CAMNT_0007357423 /DNA_START=870 /DNA_END=1667 /DNA_ORIENTATION=-
MRAQAKAAQHVRSRRLDYADPCSAFRILGRPAVREVVVLRSLCVCQFILFASSFGYTSNLPLLLKNIHARQDVHATMRTLGNICSFGGSISVAAFRLLGLTERLIGCAGLSLMPLAYAFAAFAPNQESFYSLGVLVGLGNSVGALFANQAATIAPDAMRGVVQALLGAFIVLGEFAGPGLMAGMLGLSTHSSTPNTPLLGAAFGCVFMLILWLAIAPRQMSIHDSPTFMRASRSAEDCDETGSVGPTFRPCDLSSPRSGSLQYIV